MDHDQAVLSSMMASISDIAGKPGNTTLKFEPFLLHVETRNLERARDLVALGLRSGFRESGIVFGRRYIVALRCSVRLEIPIVHQGKKLVTDEYIAFLADEVARKFARNREKIATLYAAVTAALGAEAGVGSISAVATSQESDDWAVLTVRPFLNPPPLTTRTSLVKWRRPSGKNS